MRRPLPLRNSLKQSTIKKEKVQKNKNIFTENDYKLKKSLKFNEKEEINCSKFFIYNGKDIILLFDLYILFYNLISIFQINETKLSLILLRIPNLIMCLVLFLFVKNLKNLINNTTSIRIIILFIHSIDLYLYCYSLPKDDETNCLFRINVYYNSYLFTLLINFVFALGIPDSMFYFFIDSLMLLCFYGHRKCNIFQRFLKNFFSKRLLGVLVFFLISVYTESLFCKIIKKLWALFDSYKKSYYSLRTISDNIPIPVLVVKKDLTTIIYQNTATEKFIKQYVDSGVIPPSKEDERMFKDIFNLNSNEIMSFFKEELEGALKKKKPFFFPFPIFGTDINVDSFFDVDRQRNLTDNKGFIKLYCYPTKWKGYIDCYYIMINEFNFIFQGGRVLLNNFINSQMELEKVIYNINTTCLNLTKIDSSLNSSRADPQNSIFNWSSKLTPRQKAIKKNAITTPIQTPSIFSPNLDKKKNLKGAFFDNKSLSSSSYNELSTSKLMLFYVNLSSNFTYDLYLTNYVYNAFIEKKIITELNKFNFNNLLNYMTAYLSTFALTKNFTINIINNNQDNKNKNDFKEDVIGIYIYIRVMIFNILMFIIENTNDKKSKTININTEHIKFGKQNGNFYRLSFSFTDGHPLLSYESLKLFFKNFNYKIFKQRDPIKTYNIVRSGLIIPSFISEIGFNLEDNDNASKQFDIEVSAGNKINISTIIYFNDRNTPLNKNSHKIFPMINQNSYLWRLKTFKLAKMFNEQNPFCDIIEDDEYISMLDDFTVEKDKSFVYGLRTVKMTNTDIYNLEKMLDEETKYNKIKDLKINFKKIILKKHVDSFVGEEIISKDVEKKAMNSFDSLNDLEDKLKNYSLLSAKDVDGKLKIKYTLDEKNIKLIKEEFSENKISRILILENVSGENSYKIFSAVKETGFSGNIDMCNNGNTLIEKCILMFKKSKIYNYIIADISEQEIKGYDAIRNLREIEKEKKIHTKVIGVSDNKYRPSRQNIENLNYEILDKVLMRPLDSNVIAKILKNQII